MEIEIDAIKEQLAKEGVLYLPGFFTQSFPLPQTEQSYVPLMHSYATASCELPPSVKTLLDALGWKIAKTMLVELTWKDYAVLDDDLHEGNEAILDLTLNWNDDAGGAIVYSNLEGSTISAPAQYGALLLAEKNGLKRYLQYCNVHSRGKKRILLIAQTI